MSNYTTAEHLKQVSAGGFIELTFFREKTLLGKMDLSGLHLKAPSDYTSLSMGDPCCV